MKTFRFFFLFILVLWGCGGSAQAPVEGDAVPQELGMARVMIPEMPAALDFCGEAMPLERFDAKESLMRELLITCYMHSRTMIMLLSSERYFSIIEPILKKRGVPEDFKYLCAAESGLNPTVVSPAGAAGLWQIMSALGKEKGLEVNKQVDERYHIEKATEAACGYILDNYKRFGSWTLAAAAYNLGSAGVAQRMEKQGVKSYYDLFAPEETMRYLYRIAALKVFFGDPATYGYKVEKEDFYPLLPEYKTVTVNHKEIDWSKVASENGTNYRAMRLLNNWIREYEHANPSAKTYQIRIAK